MTSLVKHIQSSKVLSTKCAQSFDFILIVILRTQPKLNSSLSYYQVQPFASFAPLIECRSPLFNDFEAFFDEFNAIFGNLDRECTSINKLQSFHQRSHLVVVYKLKFQQLMCDILWDKTTLMQQHEGFGIYHAKFVALSEVIAQVIQCDKSIF